MNTPVRRRRRTGRRLDESTPAEKRWRPIVEEWRRSGERISAFCQGRELTPAALRHWVAEIARRDERRQAARAASEAAKEAMSLRPVHVIGPGLAGSGGMEIVLLGGRTLRLTGDFDPAMLRKVVATLEEPR